jgi:hypothetical protein
VLATTGITPTERIIAKATTPDISTYSLSKSYKNTVYLLRCRLLYFSNGRRGKGKSSRMTSVATLIAPEMTMKRAPLKQPSGWAWVSQARDTGVQRKNCAYGIAQSLGISWKGGLVDVREIQRR